MNVENQYVKLNVEKYGGMLSALRGLTDHSPLQAVSS